MEHLITLTILIIVATNLSFVTPLPMLQSSANNSDGRHSGVDIGLEIHNMHTRMRNGGTMMEDRNEKETDVVSYGDKAQDTYPVGLVISREREPNSNTLQNQLQNVHDLETAISDWGKDDEDGSGELLGLEIELATLEDVPGHSEAEPVSVSGAATLLSSVIEDLPSQLELLGANHDGQLNEPSVASSQDNHGESDGSGQYLAYVKSSQIKDLTMGSGETYQSGPEHFDSIIFGEPISGSGAESGDDGFLARSSNGLLYTDVPSPKLVTSSGYLPAVSSPVATPYDLPILDMQITQSSLTVDSMKGQVKLGVSEQEKLELELEGLSLVVVQKSDHKGRGQGKESSKGSQMMDSTMNEGIDTASSSKLPQNESMLTPMPPSNPSNHTCADTQISCDNAIQCVPKENVCDMVQDCSDGSDESSARCEATRTCDSGFFKCGPTAQCINEANVCDGIYDCFNGQDELQCLSCVDAYGILHVLTSEEFCDGVVDCVDASDEDTDRCELPCSHGYHKCNDGLQCVREELFCNGVYSCRDRSDELDCSRTMKDCEHYGMFACDGLCYPMSAKCDYTYDCESGMDEEGCAYE